MRRGSGKPEPLFPTPGRSKMDYIRIKHGQDGGYFNILRSDYNLMYEKQNGLCFICKEAEIKKNSSRLSVDHCHETMIVRGLLCLKCNSKLGWLETYRQEILEYVDNPPFSFQPLDMEMLTDRKCEWCQTPFPIKSRKDKRFCNSSCYHKLRIRRK